MPKVDQHGVLRDEIFSYWTTKDGQVRLFCQGRAAATLSGKEAVRFLARMAQSDDPLQAQLLMARATGNFKRGNEKRGKR